VDTDRAAASPGRHDDDAARRRKIAAADNDDVDDEDYVLASGGHRDTTSSLRHQLTLINRQNHYLEHRESALCILTLLKYCLSALLLNRHAVYTRALHREILSCCVIAYIFYHVTE